MTKTAEKPTKNPLEGLVRGRIVFYWPTLGESKVADLGPWPAMVTRVEVWDDSGPEPGSPSGYVTLNVNIPEPTLIGADPVARKRHVPYNLNAEHIEGTTPVGHWTWPEA